MAKRKTNVNEELLLNKVVLRPEKGHCRGPETVGRPFERFEAASAYNGQMVAGWYFPGEPGRAVALVNPSNRGTKAESLDHVAVLLECGCGVVVYDYQGFGDSPGLADVRTLVGDGRGVLEWARRRGVFSGSGGRPANDAGEAGAAEDPPRDTPLLVVGLSLGSLVAVRLAADSPAVAGLVLDGAIEPFRALRRSFGPLGAVIAEVACSQVPDELNTEKQIQSVGCPVLLVHGRCDRISAVEDAEHLAGRAKGANLWVLDDCDHLDIISLHRDAYRRRLEQFLEALAVR